MPSSAPSGHPDQTHVGGRLFARMREKGKQRGNRMADVAPHVWPQPAAITRLAASTTRAVVGRYFISSRNSGMWVS